MKQVIQQQAIMSKYNLKVAIPAHFNDYNSRYFYKKAIHEYSSPPIDEEPEEEDPKSIYFNKIKEEFAVWTHEQQNNIQSEQEMHAKDDYCVIYKEMFHDFYRMTDQFGSTEYEFASDKLYYVLHHWEKFIRQKLWFYESKNQQ